MSSAKELIAVAFAEEGYCEKASNYMLDDKTANAGSGNWTKYARDLAKLGNFYNGNKNGFPWCDVFVDWCFFKAFGEAEAKRLLCQPNYSAGAGVTYSGNYFKAQGRFHSTPAIGAQIFFGTPNNGTHTGIVYGYDDTYVYTIEGNTSSAPGVVPNGGMVRRKKYRRDYGKIYGYGWPDYTEESVTFPDTVTPKPATTRPTYFYDIQMPLLKPGMVDHSTLTARVLLEDKGYKCDTDDVRGVMDTPTVEAVKKFQADNRLTADGEIGGDTWRALLR